MFAEAIKTAIMWSNAGNSTPNLTNGSMLAGDIYKHNFTFWNPNSQSRIYHYQASNYDALFAIFTCSDLRSCRSRRGKISLSVRTCRLGQICGKMINVRFLADIWIFGLLIVIFGKWLFNTYSRLHQGYLRQLIVILGKRSMYGFWWIYGYLDSWWYFWENDQIMPIWGCTRGTMGNWWFFCEN